MNKGDKGKQAVGYIRVSTDKQEVDNQRAAINAAAAAEGMKVVFTEEQISSRKEDRQIYKVIENLRPGETLIVYELSRLARSIGEIFSILEQIKKKKAAVWVLKPEIRTGGKNDLQSSMLVFAFSVAAQVERDLISERTKNALRARKAAGVKLGRPKGKGQKVAEAAEAAGIKLEQLQEWYKLGMNITNISRALKLDRRTVGAWLKDNGLKK